LPANNGWGGHKQLEYKTMASLLPLKGQA
jgi:hypothetical protein